MFLTESVKKTKNILQINNNLILKMIKIKFHFHKKIYLPKIIKYWNKKVNKTLKITN
jgi:hypothetical protein